MRDAGTETLRSAPDIEHFTRASCRGRVHAKRGWLAACMSQPKPRTLNLRSSASNSGVSRGIVSLAIDADSPGSARRRVMLYLQACQRKGASWERAAHSARACIAAARCRVCMEQSGARGVKRTCRLAALRLFSNCRVHRCQMRHDQNRLGCGPHALHVIRRCPACDGRRRWPPTAPAYAPPACPP